MTKIYSSALLFIMTLSLAGCSKDFLKRYEKRIIGTWRITGINRIGIGGGFEHLAFRNGTFSFQEGGTLIYTNASGTRFEGKWDVDKVYDDDDTRRTLHITVADYQNQQVLSEYYEDMIFVGTNHFKANARSGFNNYMTHFRR